MNRMIALIGTPSSQRITGMFASVVSSGSQPQKTRPVPPERHTRLRFINGMTQALKDQLTAEIRRARAEVQDRKRFIKAHIGQTLIVEEATQQMKALHTRLSVLEGNLAKMNSAQLSD
jgi:hypothetical protein